MMPFGNPLPMRVHTATIRGIPHMAAPKAPLPLLPPGPVVSVPTPPPSAAAQAAAQAALQAASAAKVAALDAAIEADPYDLPSWDGRMREALQSNSGAEDVFERAVKQFPFAARIWMAYAEWCEAQDTAQALAVYQRCIQQVPNLDLWLGYLGVCKRFLPLEDVLRAYARAVDLLGADSRAGLLWAEYISLLKHTYNVQRKKDNPDAEVSGQLLAEDANPIEAARRAMKPALKKRLEEGSKAADLSEEEFLRVGDVLRIDTDMIRKVFQRAVSSAHSALEKLWIGYEQFEKSLGNPQLAQKILAEHMPRFVKGKSTFKELQTLCNGIDHSAIAVPLGSKCAAQQGKLLERWRGVLQLERNNPLRLPKRDLQARVTLVYQQAVLGCAYHAELWHDFVDWLDSGGQRDEATACLRRAVERFLPRDLTLRLLLAQRYELSEVPPSAASLEAADEEYQKLLQDMPKPCPLALINYLAYVRRQRGGYEFRSAFLEATESSAHCTWEVYSFAALTEYHVFGSLDAASRTFRLGLERYGDREPSLLAAYVNFLVGANDLRSARAELSRGVLDRLQAGVRDRMSNRSDPKLKDSLAFLWQKWARLERCFGDAAAIRRCAAFRDEEYRNLQRDQELEDDAVAETPAALGLSMTISEVEEGLRFQHLVPQAARAASAPKAATPAGAKAAAAAGAAVGPLVDHAVGEAVEEHRRLSNAASGSALSIHIARPDVSKMLAFRPALDVVGLKKAPADGSPAAPSSMFSQPRGLLELDEQQVPLPTMIPKCLQDLLAVLPARPLKGAKPDVDYLLTVLQTVHIPPIPVKELERFRYDSLRLLKEEDNNLLRRRGLVKDEMDGDGGSSFFGARPTVYRERLQAKRQRLAEGRVKVEG